MFDFQEIDKKLRSHDTRLTWLERTIQAQHETQMDYHEKMQTLYDLLDELKKKIPKEKK